MIESWNRLAGIAVMCALAGCAADATGGDDVGGASEALTTQGTVFNTGGAGLNVRASTTTSSGVVGWLAEGQTVTVSCQTAGQWIGGTNIWNYIPAHGGYVSDAYLWTGYDGYVPGVPDCAGGCGDVDYQGYCDGDTLVWCEGGSLQSVDCSATGRTCGWQSSSVGYNCLEGGGGGGGRLTIGQIVGGASYYVSQDYGPTSFDGGYSYCHAYGNFSGLTHCGIDIAIPYGTPLYVPEDGTVVISGESIYFEDETNPSAGELRIELPNETHVILGHMSDIALWTGQGVGSGQYAGLSGTANGGHVHIEVRVRDWSFASGYRTVDPAVYFGY